MSFDLPSQLGLVSRVVHTRNEDGEVRKVVVASRAYPTDPDDLWDAITSPERLPRWFMPVSGDLELGGRYQLQGNAGGTITACDPPRHLALTWEFGGGVTWVTVRLEAEGAHTRLTLEHEAPLSEHWDRFGPGAVGVGWDLSLIGLARHLESPEAARPPEADESWATSPEALDVYRVTSAAWGRAAIEDGEPDASALAAAEQTRAFYSGEPG